MHAIADGDLPRLSRWGLASRDAVRFDMLKLAARAGYIDVLRWLLLEAVDVVLPLGATASQISLDLTAVPRCFRVRTGQSEPFSQECAVDVAAQLTAAAAHGGHVGALELLADHGLLQLASTTTSALHEASRCGHPNAVTWLLGQRAEVQLRSGDREQPLHCAAFFGHEEVVRLLLAARADPHTKNGQGSTSLSGAAFNGHQAVAESLLRALARVDEQDPLGMTPLHHAAIRGHDSLTRRLVLAGAVVDLCDQHGRTPLHLAAHGYEDAADKRCGFRTSQDTNLEAAAALLDARASPEALDNHRLQPWQYAEAKGHSGVVHLLREAAKQKPGGEAGQRKSAAPTAGDRAQFAPLNAGGEALAEGTGPVHAQGPGLAPANTAGCVYEVVD